MIPSRNSINSNTHHEDDEAFQEEKTLDGSLDNENEGLGELCEIAMSFDDDELCILVDFAHKEDHEQGKLTEDEEEIVAFLTNKELYNDENLEPYVLGFAEYLYKNDRPNAACKIIKHVLSIDQNNVCAHTMLSLYLDDLDEALYYSNKATALDPNQGDPYIARNNIYRQREQRDEEVSNNNNLLKLDPNHPEVIQARKILSLDYFKSSKLSFYTNKNLSVALFQINQAISFADEDPELYYLRAKIKLALNDFAGSLDDVNKIMERNPDFPQLNLLKIRIDLEKAEWQDKSANTIDQDDYCNSNSEETIDNKDPYSILGVSKSTTLEDIRKAYFKLLLKNHPDKVLKNGPKSENLATQRTKKINWAYKILTDENERKNWESQKDQEEASNALQLTTSEEQLSESFRELFAQLHDIFSVSPLEKLPNNIKHGINELNELPQNKYFGDERYQAIYFAKETGCHYPDVYQYIEYLTKEKQPSPSFDSTLLNNLTPAIVIDVLIKFLSGELYGNDLIMVANALAVNETHASFELCSAVLTILTATSMEKDYQKILVAIERICEYAERNNERESNSIIKLMQHQHFRYLVADTTRYYWKDDASTSRDEVLAKTRSELPNFYTLSYGKILLNIEMKMLKAFSKAGNVDDLYECGYLLIDLCKLSYLCRQNKFVHSRWFVFSICCTGGK